MPPPGQNTTPDPGFFSVKEYIQQIVYESSTTGSNIQPVPIYFANLKKLQKFNLKTLEASKLIILILWWVNKSFKGKKSFSNLAYIKNSPITVFFLIYYANQFQFRFLHSLENIILNKIAYKTFICIIYMGICILLVFDIQGAKKSITQNFYPHWEILLFIALL